MNGSRWNPPGLTAVLHASLSPETALAEYLAVVRRAGLSVQKAMPLVHRAVRCRLRSVLDLRDGGVRRAIKVSEDRLLGADWQREQAMQREAITQAVGRAAFAAGFEGLLTRSAADPAGENLVVFVAQPGVVERVVLDEGVDSAR